MHRKIQRIKSLYELWSNFLLETQTVAHRNQINFLKMPSTAIKPNQKLKKFFFVFFMKYAGMFERIFRIDIAKFTKITF